MKNIKILIASLMAMICLHSCEKNDIAYEELSDSKEDVLIYTAKARGGIKTIKTFSLEDEKYLAKDTVTFNAGFGALGLPKNKIDITFSIDNRVFDSINDIRELNGEKKYVQFPNDAYSVNTMELTIPKGGEYSNFSTMVYDPEKFDIHNNYLIAFTISDASGYKINSEVKTVVFRVTEVIIPEPEPNLYDKVGWEIIDVSSEETVGEGSNGFASNIIDDDINTYWHTCWSGCTDEQSTYPHHITVDMKTEKDVNGIQFAQRQAGTRGVNLIEIEVSDTEEEWRSLGDFNLINSVAPQLVSFEELEAFRYFRIIIKSGHNDSGAAFVALGDVSPYVLK